MDTNIFTKILSSITVFNIDNKKKCILLAAKQHKMISEGSVKIGLMKIQPLHNNLLKYFKTIILNCKDIFCLYYSCHQINAALNEPKRLLSKTHKKVSTLNF